MHAENWYEKLKRRRTEKKIEKFRQQFGFLIEEFKLDQKNSFNYLTEHQEKIANMNILSIEQKFSDSIAVMEILLESRINKMFELLQELKTEFHEKENEINSLLVEILKKTDELKTFDFQTQESMKQSLDGILEFTDTRLTKTTEKIESVVNERMISIQNNIDQSQAKSDDIKKVLQNINLQLDSVQKSSVDIVNATGIMFDEKASGIMLSIEEIKTLMKVVAVNNLLEEI